MAVAAQDLIERFRERYGAAEGVRVFRAPGRVNLIGEHTDYNNGFVLPIALEMATHVAAAPNREGFLRIASETNGESVEVRAADIPALQPRKDWSDYVAGVAVELRKAGYEIPGADLLIRSTVPIGAGLSSSAALEISSALALLNGRPMERMALAKLGQRAENNFAGMPCGLMDQFIAVFGEPRKAVLLDCLTQEHQAAALPEGVEILAVNTLVKHDLGASAYRVRVRECRDAVEAARRLRPDVKSLRDLTSREVESIGPALPDNVYRRARHVTTENERVRAFVEAAGRGALEAMGKLLVASHRSLQRDYEVSCEELDFLVDTAIAVPGVYGARMTGGGFGGCTVNLMKPEAAAPFREAVSRAYKEKFGIEPAIYECRPSAGAGEVL